MKRLIGAMAALAGVFAIAGSANAVTTSLMVKDDSHNLFGKVIITTSPGHMTVKLTDLLDVSANNWSDGSAIGGVYIGLLGPLPSSVHLDSASGGLIKFTSKTTFVHDTTDSIDHWGAGASGDDIFLETAGPYAQGGQPNDLITYNASSYSVNSSVLQHNPYIQGAGTFDLSFPGFEGTPNVNAGDVWIEFGTTGTNFYMACPEPTTWAMFILGFGMLGAVMRRRARTATAAAAA
jgi:hypothetical protein